MDTQEKWHQILQTIHISYGAPGARYNECYHFILVQHRLEMALELPVTDSAIGGDTNTIDPLMQ